MLIKDTSEESVSYRVEGSAEPRTFPFKLIETYGDGAELVAVAIVLPSWPIWGAASRRAVRAYARDLAAKHGRTIPIYGGPHGDEELDEVDPPEREESEA